jgi:hypothetical protein
VRIEVVLFEVLCHAEHYAPDEVALLV